MAGCGKSFTRKHALKVHVQTVHENARPFECPICQSTFGHKHLLARHISTVHEVSNSLKASDEPPEVGETVSVELTASEFLGGLAYERDRPFPCNQCRLRFSRQYDLDRHLSSHK